MINNDNKSPLDRQDGESDLSYHKRLVFGKLKDKTLADYDYSELASYVYGKEYSADVSRRMMYGSCKTLEILDDERINSVHDPDMLSDINMKMIELQMARQKFFDQRTAFNKTVRERSRQEEINELIIDAVCYASLPKLEYEFNPCVADFTSDNDILVSLNDLHYGAEIDSYWRKYNSNVCKDMMNNYLDKIITIGKLHNSENCIVVCGGDTIMSNIHYSVAVTNKENVIEQVTGVSELISEFLFELSKHFRTVRFASVAGNHSRINPNKDKTRYDERLDDIIEWYAKARLQNVDNVIFDDYKKIDPTMLLIDIRGKTYCGVHGDYDGSDSKIQSLKTMAMEPVYAILSAHKHHNCSDMVQGVKVLMGGSFLGMDDYCVQKRIFGQPQQMVCICDSSGIRCQYDVDL